jgi:hypothetical protein
LIQDRVEALSGELQSLRAAGEASDSGHVLAMRERVASVEQLLAATRRERQVECSELKAKVAELERQLSQLSQLSQLTKGPVCIAYGCMEDVGCIMQFVHTRNSYVCLYYIMTVHINNVYTQAPEGRPGGRMEGSLEGAKEAEVCYHLADPTVLICYHLADPTVLICNRLADLTVLICADLNLNPQYIPF